MRYLDLFALALVFALNSPAMSQEDAVVEPGQEISEMFRTLAPQLKQPEPKTEVTAEPGLEKASPDGGTEMTVDAYAYSIYGHTASGAYTQHGSVAVDTRVIPMGTKMYIPGYGWGVAADTGGSIRGNKIDLWMPSTADCYRWGVRKVKIKVFPR